MREASITPGRSVIPRLSDMSLPVWLGLLVGFFMPAAAAAIYPTYMHQMPQPWLEWTRLMELPFVACEMVVIHIALRRGLREQDIWRSLPRDVKVAFGLLVAGLLVSSALVSKNAAASLTLSLFTLVHLRFALAIFHLARAERLRDIEQLVPLLAGGVVFLGLLTAWKFGFPPREETVFGGRIEWGSALPGFISVRHFGSWTGAIAAGLLVALLYPSGSPAQRWTKPLYFIAATLTVWSGTRAAVLAAVVVGLIFLVTVKRRPGAGALGTVAGLSAAAALAALCLPSRSPEFLLFASQDLQSADIMTGGRLELWAQTYHKWVAAPLFGWGSGSTFWEVNIGWLHTQPHNVVLQFLISWGLVGAAGGLWLLGRAIAAVHRCGVADAALRPLTGMMYALLFMSLLEGMLHYPRFIMVIMVGFAVILAQRAMGPQSSAA